MAKVFITQKATEDKPTQIETIKTKLTADEIIKLIKRYDRSMVVL